MLQILNALAELALFIVGIALIYVQFASFDLLKKHLAAQEQIRFELSKIRLMMQKATTQPTGTEGDQPEFTP